MGPEGFLGTVTDVIRESMDEPARIMVSSASGQNMMLQPGSYQVDNGMLRIGTGSFQADQPLPSSSGQLLEGDIYRTQTLGGAGDVEMREVQAGQGLVVPVIREEIRVDRQAVEGGGVRVHKRVEEREEVVEQPTFREEVTVERVALGRPLDQAIGSRQEGDTLIIPVLEEMLVVEKRLVLKEEVRITKRRINEVEQARVLLREEHVEIEQLDDTGSVA